MYTNTEAFITKQAYVTSHRIYPKWPKNKQPKTCQCPTKDSFPDNTTKIVFMNNHEFI